VRAVFEERVEGKHCYILSAFVSITRDIIKFTVTN